MFSIIVIITEYCVLIIFKKSADGYIQTQELIFPREKNCLLLRA